MESLTRNKQKTTGKQRLCNQNFGKALDYNISKNISNLDLSQAIMITPVDLWYYFSTTVQGNSFLCQSWSCLPAFSLQQAFLLCPHCLVQLTMVAIFIAPPPVSHYTWISLPVTSSSKALSERLDPKPNAFCHLIIWIPVTFHTAHSHCSWLLTNPHG